MRFRLRYQQQDIELIRGAFAVGRSTSCQLSLEDPLVSRKHAVFDVGTHDVTLEDLGSRNGVIVNDRRIDGKVSLSPGDRIIIGSQELMLVEADEGVPSPAVIGPLTLPKLPLEHEPAVARPSLRPASSFAEMDGETSMVRRVDQFTILSSVAEKALAMGRVGEAERLLASALADVIEATRAARPLPPTLVDQAAKFSAKLASATGKSGWADYVIELYHAQERACPPQVIDELYTAMRKVTSVDLKRLRAYIDMLRQNLSRLGPAERFLVQRIEGLEKLATLR